MDDAKKPVAVGKSAARKKPAASSGVTAESPAGITVKREQTPFHNLGNIDAMVAWVAVARIAGSGSETVHEDDDVVRPQVFHGQSAMNLWRNEMQFFSLRLETRESGKCVSVPLVFYDDVERRGRWIAFKSLEHAKKLKAHLVRAKPLPAKKGEWGYRIAVGNETLNVGFPMSEAGKLDTNAVNLNWEGERGDARDKFARLYYDLSEPADFPIRTMRREETCPD